MPDTSEVAADGFREELNNYDAGIKNLRKLSYNQFMVKYKEIIFVVLILLFLCFSFSPTIYELYKAVPPTGKLADPGREFIMEHNYWWPDFNLYLSKVRQGWEGRMTALERYTSEPHQGSLIQEFYLVLGHTGKIIGLDPNFSYQLGRFILSPVLLLIILLLVRTYFRSFAWQVLAFITVIVSGSFPRFYADVQGLHIARYMEWWSNIDALQRITFIPHIVFGQIVSFYLLYQLTFNPSTMLRAGIKHLTRNKLLLYIFVGNLIGLVFPPSLITLIGVLMIIVFIRTISKLRNNKLSLRSIDSAVIYYLLYVICSLPSLLYIFIITKSVPWSTLVIFHRTHPMMIPFNEYIMGTGPIVFLGLAGAVVSIIRRDRLFQPMIYWVLVTFAFAVVFTHVKEQSPLRFTQTGLFIPLGILGAYLFEWLFHLSDLSNLRHLFRPTIVILVTLYLLGSLYMMKVSFDWQKVFFDERRAANLPPVPYPPYTLYPLTEWMDGIRWLRDNTDHNEAVVAEFTAGNFIPAYSGNIVFFGQSNTVDYDRKQIEVTKFFKGDMSKDQGRYFLQNGKIKYVFFSVQEKERANGKDLKEFYPFLKPVYSNSLVTIYK